MAEKDGRAKAKDYAVAAMREKRLHEQRNLFKNLRAKLGEMIRGELDERLAELRGLGVTRMGEKERVSMVDLGDQGIALRAKAMATHGAPIVFESRLSLIPSCKDLDMGRLWTRSIQEAQVRAMGPRWFAKRVVEKTLRAWGKMEAQAVAEGQLEDPPGWFAMAEAVQIEKAAGSASSAESSGPKRI